MKKPTKDNKAGREIAANHSNIMPTMSNILDDIQVASTNSNVHTTDQFQNITGRELLVKLGDCDEGAKDGSHWLRTALKVDDLGLCLKRNDDNTESLASILIIDCDKHITVNGEEKDGAPDPQKVSQILKDHDTGHILHSSHSYYAGNKGNRYRIVLMTKTPYTKEQLPETAEAVVLLINKELAKLEVDLLAYAKENNTWALPWYYPRRPMDCKFDTLYLEHLDGQLVDVREPVILPSINRTKPRQTKQIKAGSISPIDAFNNQHSLIDGLIHYGYKRILSNKWLRPNSSSGKPGIIVKDDKFFSHHGDVFNDGYWHDCFDLMRGMEGLTEHEAIIKAAQNTMAPDGRTTIDEHNKSLFSKGDNMAGVMFSEYQPFNNELLPVEQIPYKTLPDQMENFIKEQSLIRGCPDDFILVSLLARLGLLFAGKIKIALTRNTNYHASPNFFWIMVGDPSSGKTNALSATGKPIREFESLARDIYKKAHRIYQEEMDSLTRQLVAAKKGMDYECKKSEPKLAIFKSRVNNLQQEIYALEDTMPKLKHYIIGKITVEKLILILAENPDGVLCEIDELSSLFVRLSKDENCSERELILTAYNGNVPYSYKTISRGDVLIPNLVLSILGGLQPSKLKRFITEAKNGYHDDGLLQRLQGVVYPDRRLLLPQDKQGEESLSIELNNIFQALDSLPSGDQILLRFDDEAQNIFDEWREDTTKQAYALDYPLNAHVGKSYEFVASLSVYLYLYENNGQLPPSKEISVRFVLCAIQLGEYFLSHAKRMYGLAYQDDMPARSLAGKLASKLVEGFKRGDIRNKDWSNLTTAEERLEAITTLIKRGYISQPIQGKYYINPEHLNE